MTINRQSLSQIFRDTRACYETIPALAESVRASLASQRMIPCTQAVPAAPARFEAPAKVFVSRKRSFEAASAYRGQRTAVLNFANFHHPGGGVVNGARAQEESICRCSTLYPCLSSEAMMAAFYLPHRADRDHRYTDDCIYTPGVTVFKSDTDRPALVPESEWYQVDVITAAAPNVAYLDEDPTPEELRALHISRLTRILDVCAQQGAEVVILGAFGCGAFGNDPEVVSRAMAEVVARYRHAFRTIEFAVLSGTTPTRNYATFARTIGEAFPD